MASASPEKSQLIQAYMILHSQQTNVRRRLSVDSDCSSSSGSPSSSTSSSANTSPMSSFTAPSPEFSFSTKSPPSTGVRRHSRSSSMSSRRGSLSPPTSPNRTSITSIPEEPSAPAPLSGDEAKLADISSRIKTTLTDLLNCDAVKTDPRMRSWVATRLMDVEHELKEQKRRRHSCCAEDANMIASHLCV
ncbi:hypothetical protein E4T48_00775 [Aureobasidium sp. EXF-10727]|nr:hypothetical protein E4T48_00775 [Aureobasidium sp. EXF-10727]KAI4731889.1 hypothetical protein E4T49_00042 [Aureobasidium sp. EXF-10728]